MRPEKTGAAILIFCRKLHLNGGMLQTAINCFTQLTGAGQLLADSPLRCARKKPGCPVQVEDAARLIHHHESFPHGIQRQFPRGRDNFEQPKPEQCHPKHQNRQRNAEGTQINPVKADTGSIQSGSNNGEERAQPQQGRLPAAASLGTPRTSKQEKRTNDARQDDITQLKVVPRPMFRHKDRKVNPAFNARGDVVPRMLIRRPDHDQGDQRNGQQGSRPPALERAVTHHAKGEDQQQGRQKSQTEVLDAQRPHHIGKPGAGNLHRVAQCVDRCRPGEQAKFHRAGLPAAQLRPRRHVHAQHAGKQQEKKHNQRRLRCQRSPILFLGRV